MNTLDKETVAIINKARELAHEAHCFSNEEEMFKKLDAEFVDYMNAALKAFAQAVIEHVGGGEAVAVAKPHYATVMSWEEHKTIAVFDASLVPVGANLYTAPPALEAECERLKEALIKLRDCDWVITLPDRMDAVRKIAGDALKDKHE